MYRFKSYNDLEYHLDIIPSSLNCVNFEKHVNQKGNNWIDNMLNTIFNPLKYALDRIGEKGVVGGQ